MSFLKTWERPDSYRNILSQVWLEKEYILPTAIAPNVHLMIDHSLTMSIVVNKYEIPILFLWNGLIWLSIHLCIETHR